MIAADVACGAGYNVVSDELGNPTGEEVGVEVKCTAK
jgi:hypothetical protein